jgi:DNA-directed RNA polymerase specialized sigma24 family protein
MQINPPHATPAAEHQIIMAGRLKAGDESVLVEILAAFGPPIISVLGQKYPSLAGYAEDVLAEALHSLWRNRGVYDPRRTPLRRWFFIVAEHIAIDWIRSNWQTTRRAEAGGGQEEIEVVQEDGRDISHEFASMTKIEKCIYEIVSQLSITDQKILHAHARSEEGEAWAADLSGEIGLKPGAIRVRLGRIHGQIEEEMGRRGYDLKRVRRSAPRTIPIESGPDHVEGSPQ